MKKAICFILSILLILSFAACGEKRSDDTSSATADESVSVKEIKASDDSLSTDSSPTDSPVTEAQGEQETFEPISYENTYISVIKESNQRKYGGWFYITGQETYTTQEVTNRLPMVMLDSPDAQKVNEEIQSTSSDFFEDVNNDEMIVGNHTDFVTALNGDILSLATETAYQNDHLFRVYNFDVSTGKLISNEDVVALSDVSLEQAQQMIIDGASEQYKRKYDSDYPQKDLDITASNVSGAKYYYNSDKQLVALYDLWGTPGAGDSLVVLPLDAYYQG